jgi:hypothetical protein
MDGQPDDKSPSCYRASLRDEVKTGFQMPKLSGRMNGANPQKSSESRSDELIAG